MKIYGFAPTNTDQCGLLCVKSEFDENESNAEPPQLLQPDDKESELDLPEDLNLDDDDDAGADNAEDTAADDLAGDYHIYIKLWLIVKLEFILTLYHLCTLHFSDVQIFEG